MSDQAPDKVDVGHPGHRVPAHLLQRMGRLVRKEVSTILRDRRTIITLVLMPLLLYPLLSFAFRQFLLVVTVSQRPSEAYRIGVPTQQTKWEVERYLEVGAEVEPWRAVAVVGTQASPLAPGPLLAGATELAGRAAQEPRPSRAARAEVGRPAPGPQPPVRVEVRDNLEMALGSGEIDVALIAHRATESDPD